MQIVVVSIVFFTILRLRKSFIKFYLDIVITSCFVVVNINSAPLVFINILIYLIPFPSQKTNQVLQHYSLNNFPFQINI